MRHDVRFLFRDKPVSLGLEDARTTLLAWLRTRLRAVGTKEGCAEGDCGACTVVLERNRDGRVTHEAVNACILLAGQADGARVVTIEDLEHSGSGELHPVQAAMIRHHGAQCGFCTPGIVMSLYALHARGEPAPTRDTVCDQLAGNLCRCTGYRPIIDAALDACASAPATAPPAPDLAAIADEEDVFLGDDNSFFAAPASEKTLADLYYRHEDARLVGGATDLGLTLTKGLSEPRKIIWLGRVRRLAKIVDDADYLYLSAGVTHAEALPYLAGLHPDLGEVMRRFGSVQVRNSGTVGGNIANASPIGDLAPCLIALGAELEMRCGNRGRKMPLEGFFIDYRKQDRRPGEYVRGLAIRKLGPCNQYRAFKITKRMDEDISAVLGAFNVEIDGDRIVGARIAYGGMAAIPKRAGSTEAAIVGASLTTPQSWQPALDALARDFQPIDDHRASAAYRLLVARNLLRKALLEFSGASPLETRLAHALEVRDAAE